MRGVALCRHPLLSGTLLAVVPPQHAGAGVSLCVPQPMPEAFALPCVPWLFSPLTYVCWSRWL